MSNTIENCQITFPWMHEQTTSPYRTDWNGTSTYTSSYYIYQTDKQYSFTIEKLDVGFNLKIFSYGNLVKNLAITKRKKLMKNMDFFLQYPEDAIDYWNTFKKAL